MSVVDEQRQDTAYRRRTLNPVHWRIGTKIAAIVFIVVLVSVVSLTTFSYSTLSSTTMTSKGEEMMDHAYQALQRSSDVVLASVDGLRALALSPSIVEAVEAANAEHAGRDQAELEAQIATLDQAWKDEDPSVQALVNQIVQNQVSEHLRDFMAAFPEEVEVFVTDIHGLNVAMTERTGDYLQADESWWINAYDEGRGAISTSEVDYDDTAEAWAIEVGVPVRDEAGRVIGILRGTVDISVVFDGLSEVAIGRTGHAALLDREGKLLYAHDQSLLMERAPEQILALIGEGNEGWRPDGIDVNGNPAIVAYHHLEGELADSLGWTILLDQDLEEANAPLRTNLLTNSLVAGGIASLMVVLGLVAARSITLPLAAVTRQAQRLALGNVGEENEETVEQFVRRGDETGDLMRAFQQLRDYVRQVAARATQLANGDLTTDVHIRDEQDVLGHAFAEMVSDLRHLIGQVAESALGVRTAAEQFSASADQSAQATQQVAATIQQVASGTAQQTQSVTQASATVEQVIRAIDGLARGAQEQAASVSHAADITANITTAVRQVTANAQSGSAGAAGAARTARQGASTIQATIEGIEGIRTSVGLVSQRVAEMGQRSEQIGAIVETIDDIASQTNLLALNAAIEAARAGEHGKGFAVVADEVRKLAEMSTAATQEIAGLIKEVQDTTTEAIRAMEEGSTAVDTGVSRADEARQALDAILVAIEGVHQQVEEISVASGQMDTSTNELVSAMDTVSAVVEENTAASEEMAASAGEVTGTIENIAVIAEENSAASEEVSATVEEVTAQAEEVTASAQALADMAVELETLVDRFTLPGGNRHDPSQQTIQATAPSLATTWRDDGRQ